MNNQPYEPWSKAKLADWKRFWESDLGKEYLQRLENTKQLIFAKAMDPDSHDIITNLLGRAAGIEAIIQDINAIVLSATESTKEEKPKKKK